MRIKLDENLPAELAAELCELGHDTDTVNDEGLSGSVDEDVWRAAQAEGRFLVTQDLDFSDVRKYAPGTHCGLLLVRLREPGRIALRQRVVHLFATHPVESWTGCLVIATERKVRVRRAAT